MSSNRFLRILALRWSCAAPIPPTLDPPNFATGAQCAGYCATRSRRFVWADQLRAPGSKCIDMSKLIAHSEAQARYHQAWNNRVPHEVPTLRYILNMRVGSASSSTGRMRPNQTNYQ